ncbi:MAG TPA: aminotransferase class V-fold PLP-dependent enzyme [Anaerolineales bacterium]|nr:aminotransferase class V-fold PLP-dependent enzyme [Anaerolineales bacterium]
MDIKNLFLLDPGVVYLNHGSFGATPRPVFKVYQQWQQALERQPVHFFNAELMVELAKARQTLGTYLGAPAEDLACIPNATHAVNLVARSLDLKPGDEILSTNHEYGACNNVWEFICQKSGAHYIRQTVPLPITSPQEVLHELWQAVTPRTRIIFLSHIASSTAACFPVEAVCRRARQAGILTFIDGAHAPGQIPLDLVSIGADFYTGNCHKWMLAPKGSAFLYARQEVQSMLEPLVVSWGWGQDSPFDTGSRYLDNLQWSGTDDYSAYLSVPAAIRFQADHDWDHIRVECHQLLRQALERISGVTGIDPPYAQDEASYYQMAVAPLPPIAEPKRLKDRLYEEFHIEVPCTTWENHQSLRISVQGYNTQADIDTLLNALKTLLKEEKGPHLPRQSASI